MSQEKFVEFCRLISCDEHLASRIQCIQAASEVVVVADELGYPFTEIEMQVASRELAEQSESELSEHELEQLSGGYSLPSAGVFQAGAAIFKLGRKLRWW